MTDRAITRVPHVGGAIAAALPETVLLLTILGSVKLALLSSVVQ